MTQTPLLQLQQFECQRCGHVIDHWPQDDCELCGHGHWTSPPKGIARKRQGVAA